MSEPALARALHGIIEPLHSVMYFVPEASAGYEALGLEPRAQGYVAGRAAPMGAVGPGVAFAAFYNFNRAVIDLGLPGAWEIASPRQVLQARARAMEDFFTRIEAPTDTLAAATQLAREAADAADFGGRPLAAANTDVEAPGTPFADLWQALAVLREHRGDGHVALLTASPLTPVEALVMYAAWQDKVGRRFLQGTRLWDDESWAASEDRLRELGWLDDAGAPTAEGRAWRDGVEAETDALAAGPYAALGEQRSLELFDLLVPLAEAVRDSGAYPRELRLPDRPA